MTKLENILKDIPGKFKEEVVKRLVFSKNLRIERVVSPKSNTPSKLYDQDENEFVMLVDGYAELEFGEDRQIVNMKRGDYFNIPSHLKHRVLKTRENSVWLAVFYK